MKHAVPAGITSKHRRRSAILYFRAPGVPETPWARGDNDRQLEQELYAREWGWESVTVLHEDLGTRGLGADRSSLRQLYEMVAAGRVGLVLLSTLSQFAPSRAAVLEFLETCRRADTLVAVDGRLLDLAQTPANFSAELFRLVSEFHRDLTTLFKNVDTLLEELD